MTRPSPYQPPSELPPVYTTFSFFDCRRKNNQPDKGYFTWADLMVIKDPGERKETIAEE